MKIDYKIVKALSSPTRLEILNRALEEETTPTSLSNDLGKSKSTICSHLTKLEDAGLLEKEKIEGRKRVVYKPTKKAENIVKGRRKKVRFSLGTSAVSSFIGGFFIYQAFTSFGLGDADDYQAQSTTMDAAPEHEVAEEAVSSGEALTASPELFLGAAAIFLGIAFIGVVYYLAMRRLSN